MSKKIISIILTIAMILCQGTLCLGTVSAAEGEYIVDPVGYDVTLDADAWTPCQLGTSVHNNDDGELVFVNEGFKNDNKGRYDSGWLELRNISIDVRDYYAIEIITFVEDSKPLTKLDGTSYTDGNDTRVQFYFSGTGANNSVIKASEANSTGTQLGKYTVVGDATNGYYSEDYGIYSCELMGAWSEMETLTTLRMDALKNSSGTVRIKSIRLIGAPGISGIGFNSAYEADIDAMPVDPDTIDIAIAGSMESIDGAVTITDPDGNEVPLTGAIIAGGKASLELAPGTELAEFTDYTVTFDTNTKLSSTKYLQEPISFTFTTDDSKAPSIFDAIDPDRPSDYTDDNIIWSAEFKSDADLAYFKSGSGIKTEIAYGEYLKYTSQTPIINNNKNLQSYYIATKFDTPVDANMINTLQFRMKIVNAVVDGKITGTVNGETITKDRVPPNFVMYFAGVNDDGSSFVMNSSHSHSASYKILKDDEGNGYTEWAVYEYNLNSIKSWVAARDITSIRFDFSNNCESELLVDYVRLIGPKMPEIENVKYNTDRELDEVQGLPVNPETVELQLTEPLFEIGTDGIVFEDEYGNDVLIQKVSLLDEGKLLSIYLGQELTPDTNYFIGINEKAKIGSSAYVDAPVVAECYVGDYRALTGIELIDPARPSDAILPGEEVWSLDFKSEEEINTHFKSNSNVKTALKYNEYMEYKTESMGVGATSGLPASYFIDSDFSTKKIDANKHYRLQIRMKIDNQIMKGAADGFFKMYFKGDNGVNMSESNCDSVEYVFRTDSEGRYGTDWFVLELDLSKSAHWLKASSIETVRFDFLKNAAGTVLVDYIRFIAMPAVTELSYTNNAGTTVVGDGMTVAADTQYLNIKFSQKFPGGLKYSLVNEYGNEANIDMNNTKYVAADNTLKLAILGGLETSSTYTLSIDSSSDFAQTDATLAQKLYRPLTYSFKTEPDPITADVTKGADSTTINYANNTDDDAVLVAIATVWNGNAFVTKNISVTTVLANDTVNGVVVNHTLAAGETAEVVVMKYDAEKDSYTMISKVVH